MHETTRQICNKHTLLIPSPKYLIKMKEH